jgi:hypothetical protein
MFSGAGHFVLNSLVDDILSGDAEIIEGSVVYGGEYEPQIPIFDIHENDTGAVR